MTKEVSSLKRSPTILKVLDPIRDKIIMQELKHGDMLTETSLAEEYDVSRGSVRSALIMLESEGLISSLSNGRKTVIGINERFIKDLYEVRIMLEREAALYCINQSVIDITPLADALSKFYTLQIGPTDSIFLNRAIVNTKFHRAIIETTGNRPLLKCWETLEPMAFAIAKLNYSTLGDKTNDEELISSHVKILDLISKKDYSVVEEIEKHTSVAIVESIDGIKKMREATK